MSDGKMGEGSSYIYKLQVVISLSLFFVSHGLRTFFKKMQWTKKPVKWVFFRVIMVLILAAILSQVIIHLAMYFILDWQNYRPIVIKEAFFYAGQVFIMFIIWSSLYFSYHYWQNKSKKESENWQLKAQLKEAELTILKSQINPHFLFNALNNIRSLVLLEPEKARDMITNISELMRYFIQFNAKEKVTVAQEIRVVKDYLALEKIQFDERLTYQFEIEEKVLMTKIPPMAIQLLVENAVKHGISLLSTGGHIQVNVTDSQEQTLIEVFNSGQIKEKPSQSGIGLKNLRDRVEILFGTFGEISLTNHTSDTVKASIKIPLSL